MRLRVKVRNPLWAYRKAYASYMLPHIQEFETYEGELKKVKKNWRTPKGEFILVNGANQHIMNLEDVVEAWRKR
jgi:hypothetical protein